MSRRCSTCGKEYPKAEGNFNTNGYSAAGSKVFRSSCKICERKRAKVNRSAGTGSSKRKEQSKLSLLLSEVILCSVCSKAFVVTSLPEKPGRIELTCQSCIAAQQQKQQEIQYVSDHS